MIRQPEYQNCTWVISFKFRLLYPQKKDVLTTPVLSLSLPPPLSLSLSGGATKPRHSIKSSLSLEELRNLVTQSREVQGQSVQGKRPKPANGWSGSPWMKQFCKLRYRRSNFNQWSSLQLNVPSKPHKTPFYVIALVLWSSDHPLQYDIVTDQRYYVLTLLALQTSKSPAAQSVRLSKLESWHSFC